MLVIVMLLPVMVVSMASIVVSKFGPHAIILETRCVQCGACVSACPVGAIWMVEYN